MENKKPNKKLSLKEKFFKSKKQLNEEEKIFRSYRFSKFFKIFFYCLGFPLLIYISIIYSARFYGLGGYSETWSTAIKVMFVLWLIIGIAQLIFNKFKKSFMARSIFITVVSLVLILFSILILSVQSKNLINNAKKKYGTSEITFPILEKEYESFLPYTTGGGSAAAYSSQLSNFQRVYGIGMSHSQIGGKNTGGTLFYTVNGTDKKSIDEIIKIANKSSVEDNIPSLNLSTTKTNYFFNGDANYSTTAKNSKDLDKKNFYFSSGLYSDGMLFGLKQAHDILYVSEKAESSIKTNGYKINGKTLYNPEEVLMEELKNVHEKTGKGSYNDYYKKVVVEVHKEDFGKYNLDEARVNMILKSVAEVLNVEITGGGAGINVIEALLTTAKANNIEGIINIINSIASKKLTVNQALTFVAAIVPFVRPEVRPDIMFLDNTKTIEGTDVTIREYALSRYYGTVHGAIVSTVILPNNDGRIGRIDMNNQGILAKENALSSQNLKQLEANSSYMPKLYPKMLARRILLTGFPWLIVMLIISTYFGSKKELRLKELVNIRAAKREFKLLTDEEKEYLRNKSTNDKKEDSVKEEVKIKEKQEDKQEEKIIEDKKENIEIVEVVEEPKKEDVKIEDKQEEKIEIIEEKVVEKERIITEKETIKIEDIKEEPQQEKEIKIEDKPTEKPKVEKQPKKSVAVKKPVATKKPTTAKKPTAKSKVEKDDKKVEKKPEAEKQAKKPTTAKKAPAKKKVPTKNKTEKKEDYLGMKVLSVKSDEEVISTIKEDKK